VRRPHPLSTFPGTVARFLLWVIALSFSSLRLSEPPLSRLVRSFVRRWHKGPFRAFLESRPVPPGGPVALVDRDGTLLASVREGAAAPGDLLHVGAIEIGSPAVARLVGDVHSLPPDYVELVRILVTSVVDFETEMEQISRHALERYRELSLLYDFSEKAASATALTEVLDVVLRKAVDVVRASGASIVTLDAESGAPQVLAAVGTVPAIRTQDIARVIESGRTLVGLSSDMLHEVQGESWPGTIACIPLRTAGKTAGVLVVMAGAGREHQPEDQRLLTALASLAATRIEHSRLTEANARRRELVAIGHLASAIVHDFKNPLTAMRGFAEMIQMDHIPAGEHAALAGQIIENADRLWAMVEEILHFARGNRASLDLRPTTGAALTERFAATLPYGVSDRIRFRVDLSAIGDVVVDERKLERVVVNLVRNACEAIVGSGTVEVYGEPDDDPAFVRIIVQDDGPGIPWQIRANMFDPFVTAGKQGGTGLGLAIVRKIVEEHGGTVSVHSEAGQGTRFVITLPRNPPVGNASHEQAHPDRR
jgi:signal transduction histidine kinase